MSFRDLFGRCRWGATLCVLVLAFALAACGDDPEDNANNANNTQNNNTADAGPDAESDAGPDADEFTLEIAGVYDTNWDQVVTITDDTWHTVQPDDSTFEQTIVEFDNDDNFAITQNPDDAEFGPDKFNKEVWTEPTADGEFFHCTVAFSLDTAEEARTTENTADDSDPENGGCGGAAWTKLTPQ